MEEEFTGFRILADILMRVQETFGVGEGAKDDVASLRLGVPNPMARGASCDSTILSLRLPAVFNSQLPDGSNCTQTRD